MVAFARPGRVGSSRKLGGRFHRLVQAHLLRRGDGACRDLDRAARAEWIRCGGQYSVERVRFTDRTLTTLSTKLTKSVWSIGNLESAWRVIQHNGRSSKSIGVRAEIERFAEDPSKSLRSLRHRLSRGQFKFPAATGVPIAKRDATGRRTGKVRPIVLAPVESRIVQRAILNILQHFKPLARYFDTPYSFGGIRSSRDKNTESREESLSAVPGAIKCVLDEIGSGAKYVICADIRAFFTRVPREDVISVISETVNDEEFVDLLRKAVTTELDNMAELRAQADLFPIGDIGVAQGNSLSPLFGNVALFDFDAEMNMGDCRCIRYIDDFIIMAPTARAANIQLKRASKILAGKSMELSLEKTSRAAVPIERGFEFLGIEVIPGLVRPSRRARSQLITKVDNIFSGALKKYKGLLKEGKFDEMPTFVSVIREVDGVVNGWAKHYWFCSDSQILKDIDLEVERRASQFFGSFSVIKSKVPKGHVLRLWGVSSATSGKRTPFKYPSSRSSDLCSPVTGPKRRE